MLLWCFDRFVVQSRVLPHWMNYEYADSAVGLVCRAARLAGCTAANPICAV